MLGGWGYVVSVAIAAVGVVSAVLALRSGRQLAIVLGLDAALIAVLGIVLNVAVTAHLGALELLAFVVLPLVLALAAIALAKAASQSDYHW